MRILSFPRHWLGPNAALGIEEEIKLREYLAATPAGTFENPAERIMSGFPEKKGDRGKTKTFKKC